jgi:hypothetical protein
MRDVVGPCPWAVACASRLVAFDNITWALLPVVVEVCERVRVSVCLCLYVVVSKRWPTSTTPLWPVGGSGRYNMCSNVHLKLAGRPIPSSPWWRRSNAGVHPAKIHLRLPRLNQIQGRLHPGFKMACLKLCSTNFPPQLDCIPPQTKWFTSASLVVKSRI